MMLRLRERACEKRDGLVREGGERKRRDVS